VRAAVLGARPLPRARPEHWRATRGRLRPEELEAPLSAFEIPPVVAQLDPASATTESSCGHRPTSARNVGRRGVYDG
jgi:hypothetical protein